MSAIRRLIRRLNAGTFEYELRRLPLTEAQRAFIRSNR